MRLLAGVDEPATMPIRREQTGEDGDLGGYSLRGISLGERWIYRNPFAGARLSDDEIAIGTALERMGRYARGGPRFTGWPTPHRTTISLFASVKQLQPGNRYVRNLNHGRPSFLRWSGWVGNHLGGWSKTRGRVRTLFDDGARW